MDRLATHMVAGVQEAIHPAGASILHLPPGSPDRNPIEQAVAKLRAGLRKAGARPRDTPWATIGNLPESVSPEECRRCLATSGDQFE